MWAKGAANDFTAKERYDLIYCLRACASARSGRASKPMSFEDRWKDFSRGTKDFRRAVMASDDDQVPVLLANRNCRKIIAAVMRSATTVNKPRTAILERTGADSRRALDRLQIRAMESFLDSRQKPGILEELICREPF